MEPTERAATGGQRSSWTVLAGACTLLATLAALVVTGVTRGLDRATVRAVHDFGAHHDWSVELARILSAAGGPLTWELAAPMVIGWLWARRRRADALLLAVAVAGAVVSTTLLKIAVGRVRPPMSEAFASAGGMSFPSGHATASAAAVVALLMVARTSMRRACGVLGLLLVAGIGISRVVLGVHYPTDVLAGWLVALTWLALARGLVATPAVAQSRYWQVAPPSVEQCPSSSRSRSASRRP